MSQLNSSMLFNCRVVLLGRVVFYIMELLSASVAGFQTRLGKFCAPASLNPGVFESSKIKSTSGHLTSTCFFDSFPGEALTTMDFCRTSPGYKGLKGLFYRFENWYLARAPFCPYFLRSLTLESLRTNPARFRDCLRSGSAIMSARVIPWRMAPA